MRHLITMQPEDNKELKEINYPIDEIKFWEKKSEHFETMLTQLQEPNMFMV